MDKKEMIEEMASDIPFLTLDREVFVSATEKRKVGCTLSEEDNKVIAEELYEKGYRKINMDKWKRILDRNRKELQRLRDNEENLSKFGQHDLGYFKGRVSVLEDLFDELDIEVDDND